jgi:hypothetical protein
VNDFIHGYRHHQEIATMQNLEFSDRTKQLLATHFEPHCAAFASSSTVGPTNPNPELIASMEMDAVAAGAPQGAFNARGFLVEFGSLIVKFGPQIIASVLTIVTGVPVPVLAKKPG